MRTVPCKLILEAPETTLDINATFPPMEEVMFDVSQGSMCYRSNS